MGLELKRIMSQQRIILQQHPDPIFDEIENEPIFKFSLFDYLARVDVGGPGPSC